MESLLNNIPTNFQNLISEMNEQNFDKIRFASYRTACKIKFIQKRTNLHLIDLWNTIEILRENGLYAIQETNFEITTSQFYQILQLLFLQLNKRLPRSQNIDISFSISYLIAFFTFANDINLTGKINILFIKIALCAMCSGKFQEKLKYIFNLISNPNSGKIEPTKFNDFVKCLLELACTVNESQFYQYDEKIAKSIYYSNLSSSSDLKSFNKLFYSSSGPPPILSWFVIMHKMAQVEFVVHQTICNCCNNINFTGFRYKCQKCYNYNLCEKCFWQGKSTNTHNAETHSCKEYVTYKSVSKQFGNSLKKSLRLKTSPKHKVNLNDDNSASFKVVNNLDDCNYNITNDNNDSIENYSNLSFSNDESFNEKEAIENQINQTQTSYCDENSKNQNYDFAYDINFVHNSLMTSNSNIQCGLNLELNDEHRLIARYAANLANSESLNSFDNCDEGFQNLNSFDSNLNENLYDENVHNENLLTETVLQYELKNRELMLEIMRMRDFSPSSDYNSLINSFNNNYQNLNTCPSNLYQSNNIMDELFYLREKSNTLELQLQSLNLNKLELKQQLEQTIKIAENFSNIVSSPSSKNSTLNKNSILTLPPNTFKKEKLEISYHKNQDLNSNNQSIDESSLMNSSNFKIKTNDEVSNKSNENLNLNSSILNQNLDEKIINENKNENKTLKKSNEHKIDEQNNFKLVKSINVEDAVNEQKIEKYSDLDKTMQNNDNNQLNEEMMHKNIMSRNIDLILKRKSNSCQNKKVGRINKYELVYDKKFCGNKSFMEQTKLNNQEINTNCSIKTEQMATSINTIVDELDENNETNNSNSISSNSNFIKYDIESQPLMCFSSIAYVNANRLLNQNTNMIFNTYENYNEMINNNPSYVKMDSFDEDSIDTYKVDDLYNLSATDDDECMNMLNKCSIAYG